MSPRLACGCSLCSLETTLLCALSSYPEAEVHAAFSGSPRLRPFTDPSAILVELRASYVTAESLLAELLAVRLLNPGLIENVLLLAFIPTLHATVRRVLLYQPSLAREDVAQQSVMVLLEYLRSADLARRQSYFAVSISRAVKRKLFEWAERERKAILPQQSNNHDPADPNQFERHLLLRHFLNHCLKRRLITAREMNLLIEFKLQGGSIESSSGTSSQVTNATRQKLKRLLRKLRSLAREL